MKETISHIRCLKTESWCRMHPRTKMTFDQNGERRNYIQIGTVMTDEAYRGRGLARQLISRILDDFRECDGVYLFGNMNALDFYRKQGFFEMTQYKYSVGPEFCRSRADDSFEPAPAAPWS